ncbi:MAG: rhodanese-like domain-containing protein [Gemmatimonadaceae bacterium]
MNDPSSDQRSVPPADQPGDDPHLAELTPAELARRWAAGDRPALLDVREPEEYRIAHLAGTRLVPLATLPAEVAGLDRDAELVVYCHHGVRSKAAVDFLRRSGVRRARNLAGGIDRWSREVDPGVRRY